MLSRLQLAAAAVLTLVACGEPASTVGPTRGYLLISLDTLGARHLGVYGAERDTSPFFDQLAAEGVLFDSAFVQYPSTLVSHVSMFTGLYPQEHGVYPPSSVLADAVPSLPDSFRSAGFRTAGHTEAGYVSADFGFDRGFDEFEASKNGGRAALTFARGVDFLERLRPDERFFLFLHTYAVHDPYNPPPAHDRRYWPGDDPEVVDSRGSFLRDVNMGRHRVPPATVAFYRAQYDAEVRALDDALRLLFAELERLGLRDETTIVVTSDHGEEFAQHGKLAHSQVYPETLHVPLLVLHPALRSGSRVPDLVQSIDLAPTLYELAGIDVGLDLSGASLVQLLTGEASPTPRRTAYAEIFDQENQKTLIEQTDAGLIQYLTSLVVGESGGTWATRRAALDTDAERLDLELVSFHEPRVLTVAIDGEQQLTTEIGTGWQPLAVPLPPPSGDRHRVTLSTADCGVPLWLGVGTDTRCLSFKLQGAELRRAELYDLTADPDASHDLSTRRPELFARLAEELRRYRWELRAEPGRQELSNETVEQLKALGYLN